MKNVVEDQVASMYAELLPTVPEAHAGCPVCREDVLVYVLNRLPPHYVSTLKGEVLSRLDIQAGQASTDATVAMLDGLRFVARNPRCGATPAP
jgi:competence protein ComFB